MSNERKSLPIHIKGITKKYGEFKALDDVHLDIRSGEFMTLLGPSGSGKTTLLTVLAGFTRPSAGRVFIDNEDITRKPPHKRNLGMVFQNYALFPHMTIGENVAYPLKMRGLSKAEIPAKVRGALELVQLGHLIDRHPDQLSGGQKQRIALARAVVFEPQILLMDEPLSALDKKLREQMQIEIRHLHERLGITTVYVTHDQREALTMSNRIAVIDEGRFAQIGEPETIYTRPENLFVADFIGESSIMPLEKQGDDHVLNGVPLKTTLPVEGEGSAAYLVVRPEKLELLEGNKSDDLNVFEGKLEELVYQGDTLLIQLRLANGVILSLRRSARREVMNALPEKGGILRLGLPADDTIIIRDRPDFGQEAA